MSDAKAIKIVEGAQPASGKVKPGPLVIDAEDGDWLVRWLKERKAKRSSDQSRA